MQDATIAVEATYYLQHMIDHPPTNEPLLAALGGDPIALKHNIELELDLWKDNNITPLFVFDGQSPVGKEDLLLQASKASLSQTQKAWELYADNHPEDAVKTFGQSSKLAAIRKVLSANIGLQKLYERETWFTFFKRC